MDRNFFVRCMLAGLLCLAVSLLAPATRIAAQSKTTTANYIVNDAATSITYSGASWSYSTNRHNGDYLDDVHYCTTDGQYAQYSFTGTGIACVSETYSDEGGVSIYIDGIYKTTVNAASPNRTAQVEIYKITGLVRGTHTIAVVKAGGTYMVLDAFVVYS